MNEAVLKKLLDKIKNLENCFFFLEKKERNLFENRNLDVVIVQ